VYYTLIKHLRVPNACIRHKSLPYIIGKNPAKQGHLTTIKTGAEVLKCMRLAILTRYIRKYKYHFSKSKLMGNNSVFFYVYLTNIS